MPENKEKSESHTALGILDWGIGGLGFYGIWKTHFPGTGVCYFSDSGSVPYGKQSRGQLSRRLRQVADFLRGLGVTHLVVACNAASTVLPDLGLPNLGVDFYMTGVIDPALEAALALGGKKAGVVGGRRTVLSGAYSRRLRRSFPKVTQRIAQPLSALIERGEINTPEFQAALTKIMRPLRDADLLLLACTHYEAAADAFQELAPRARLLHPDRETFDWVMKNWSKNWHLADNQTEDVFFTSGNPAEMRNGARQAFGVEVGEIVPVILD